LNDLYSFLRSDYVLFNSSSYFSWIFGSIIGNEVYILLFEIDLFIKTLSKSDLFSNSVFNL